MRLSASGADAVALVAGLLLPLAFAPFDLFPLALLASAALFYIWHDGSPRRAAWRGFLFGLGMFGVGVSWVYVSMHTFGGMGTVMSALATLLLAAGLALYPTLLGFVQARFFDRRSQWHALLVLPALWTLFEWWRGWFLTGFPWLNLGYSHVDTPLAGYAPMVGVYGVSLVIAACAGLLVASVRSSARRVLQLSLVIALWAGGFLLARIEWAQPSGPVLRATLIQGNVPLREKWDNEARVAIMERYREASVASPASDLIVWPEAAIPALLHQVSPTFIAKLRDFSEKHDTDFLIGVLEYGGYQFYNSVVSIGHHEGIYRKQHLVPFGEYVPFKPLFFWLLRDLQIPMSDLSPGAAPQPALSAAGQSIGVSVCYEDSFGEELIRALPQATLLVNVSEDAWFGDSLAPHQRLQMARLRTIETARPMLRATNTGPSVAIDSRGRVTARAPQFRAAVLHTQVQPMAGTTPFVTLGNWLAVLLAVAMLAVPRLTTRKR